MSWTPTDEQVRLAKQVLILADDDGDTRGMSQAVSDAYERGARAVLVAVGPHIAEKAWDEGVALGYEYGRYDQQMFHANAVPTNNPYRQEAGRG